MTAMENVLIKNELTGLKSNEEILFYFDALDMTALIDRPCGEMSFGQQQRVAIISSLCQPFHFLICDEPFSHLDDHNIQKACSLIEHELTARQSSLIMLSLDQGYSFNMMNILIPPKMKKLIFTLAFLASIFVFQLP